MKSERKFTSALNRVRSFFGTVRAADLTSAGLEPSAQARLAEGVAPATVMQWLALLRAALRLAVRQDRLRRLPFFPHLELKNARAGFLEPREFLAVEAALPAPLNDVARFAY